MVADAWLARTSQRQAREWLASLDGSDPRLVVPRCDIPTARTCSPDPASA